MPYDGERATTAALRRLVSSKRVQEIFKRYKVRDWATDPPAPPAWREAQPSSWKPKHVIAIDGGMAIVPQEQGFPGAEACYLTIAAVLLDVSKLRDLDKVRPSDPVELRKTQTVGSIDCAIPGHNMVIDQEASTADSLRRVMYELLADVKLMDDGESLLQSYEGLLHYRAEPSPLTGKLPKMPFCPTPECGEAEVTFTPKPGVQVCATCQKQIFSTDALRVYEGMVEENSNQSMYSEVRQVLEVLALINILRSMERMGVLASLRDIAVVLDGPLAVFGHPAWLSKTLIKELRRINALIVKETGRDLLLIGVEKTGEFKDHFDRLDVDAANRKDQVPPGRLFLLDNGYIKKNIKFNASDKVYGSHSYFGRKFFYKTSNGSKLVGLLPFLDPSHEDTDKALPDQYPRLADALSVLNTMVSARYEGGLVPLVAANAEAAIPLNLGQRVLEQVAKNAMAAKVVA